jgi:hypothetical protein
MVREGFTKVMEEVYVPLTGKLREEFGGTPIEGGDIVVIIGGGTPDLEPAGALGVGGR